MLPIFTISVVSPLLAPIVLEQAQEVSKVPNVPFFSQFLDIDATEWKKKSCGIASLAMIIEYYEPKLVPINSLLHEGILSGAYLKNVGWKHQDLALLSEKYGLKGLSYDLSGTDKKTALAQFTDLLKDGPVIASVHYKFDPTSTIPHLLVINGIEGNTVYYNDPAADAGNKEISIADFMKGWKKRFIVIRPEKEMAWNEYLYFNKTDEASTKSLAKI
ncbi:hypothetical protein D4R99_05130 [bacterium]|nr:MAG: hypothetical protein D4R99_05130 [bacterium]